MNASGLETFKTGRKGEISKIYWFYPAIAFRYGQPGVCASVAFVCPFWVGSCLAAFGAMAYLAHISRDGQ
jgi:hypothetical protein